MFSFHRRMNATRGMSTLMTCMSVSPFKISIFWNLGQEERGYVTSGFSILTSYFTMTTSHCSLHLQLLRSMKIRGFVTASLSTDCGICISYRDCYSILTGKNVTMGPLICRSKKKAVSKSKNPLQQHMSLPSPYSERPEWKDVTPVPQDDGPAPVCSINYTAKCENLLASFHTC